MDIAAWLRDLGLDRYERAFRDNAIDADILPSLTAEDLKDIGVSAAGHRRKLLNAIARLRKPERPAGGEPMSPPGLSADRPREERRQLTVLFSNLVGSTELAARLDLEDVREVIRASQGCCAELIRRWQGHVARYLGGGVLAYFGHPRAEAGKVGSLGARGVVSKVCNPESVQVGHVNTGDTLGRYELGRRLGRGAMSEVFVSRHPLLEREVAIKVLKGEWRRDQNHLARFLDDARAAHALIHPNIVRVLDVDDSQEQPFIVMDLVDGQPLDTWCNAQVDVLAATKVARDVASALAAAHADGLIHRDVKPSNILIETRAGSAKLTDFGAAKRVRVDGLDLTQRGRIGTPRYMAPEQVEGLEVSPRTDLFALGATLYELLAGRPAFEGQSIATVFSGILLKEPPPLEQVRSDVPAALADLVRRLLSKKAEHRPATAEEVLATLNRLAQVVLPLQALPVETFKPGELLMAAGTISNRIMILKEGALEISKNGVRLGEINEPGTILGELAVLLRCPHTADVRTTRASTLHVADAQTFFEEHPGVTVYVATGLAQRLEATDARLLDMRREFDSGETGGRMRS